MENFLREKNLQSNPLLYRIAFKMATGSGKTVVMAMLIAWQALNKIANSQDARFSDTFPDRYAGYHDQRPPACAAAQ
ncbi:MAG: DEAD/DEAH box helicase family protein [Desulfobacterales bacterium]|nr:DEAD/DEAH box helicase family protein [Desulfobacterales bacterium]